MAQQSIALHLDPEAVAAFKSGNRKAVQPAIEKTIRREDRESTALASFLQGFCTNTVETYAHESLTVDYVEVTASTHGKVGLSFTGDAYMGCKGADYLHDHSEDLTYHLDLERAQLELRAEFPERRTTRDEF